METLSSYFAISDIPGHVSYLIIAISYCLSNIYWLRVAAVVGLLLEILYFLLTSSALYAGIAWDLIFIAINAFHLVLLTRDRFSIRLEDDEHSLIKGAFRASTMRRSRRSSRLALGARSKPAPNSPKKAAL